MTIYKSLADLIKENRDKLGMDNAQLARCVGVSAQYIGDMASGKKDNPDAEKIAALAKCLRVSQIEILVAMKYLPPEAIEDIDGARLLEQYRNLPEDKKEVVQNITASLVEAESNKNNNNNQDEVGMAVEPPLKKKRANGSKHR